jgi:hypothetical protein
MRKIYRSLSATALMLAVTACAGVPKQPAVAVGNSAPQPAAIRQHDAPAPAPHRASVPLSLRYDAPKGWDDSTQALGHSDGVVATFMKTDDSLSLIVVQVVPSDGKSMRETMEVIAKDLAGEDKVFTSGLSPGEDRAAFNWAASRSPGAIGGHVEMIRFPEWQDVTVAFVGMWSMDQDPQLHGDLERMAASAHLEKSAMNKPRRSWLGTLVSEHGDGVRMDVPSGWTFDGATGKCLAHDAAGATIGQCSMRLIPHDAEDAPEDIAAVLAEESRSREDVRTDGPVTISKDGKSARFPIVSFKPEDRTKVRARGEVTVRVVDGWDGEFLLFIGNWHEDHPELKEQLRKMCQSVGPERPK